MDPRTISINEYNYPLPENRIALHPLPARDASKLLVYKKGEIRETVFSAIDEYIPPETLLVLNNTKVINARIKFKKNTGAIIEIFCLEPYQAASGYENAMAKTGSSQWKCFVGGAAKWKDEILQKEITIGEQKVILSAAKKEGPDETFLIEFFWEPAGLSFFQITEAAGNVPLPPYIKRDSDNEDAERYQTVFAAHIGSVAAPTAGLHFSEEILKKLSIKNIHPAFVTLHVGAGTFKPVKADTMAGHDMHAEYLDVSAETIVELKNKIGKIAAVGTTSLRTIESLYWFGVKVFYNKELKELSLKQWDVYSEELRDTRLSTYDALTALQEWMKKNELKNIFTQTQILIAPGYNFRMVNMLITNFHQPRSTLLLLVAAAIGDDWKKMYDHALANDFRFLSYGDANLIFIDQRNRNQEQIE